MRFYSVHGLRNLASKILLAAGAHSSEAEIVAGALVESNLAGHDSHGVLRIPEYVGWMEQQLVSVGAHAQIIKDAEAFAVIDGGWGFGQVIGREAMQVAIQKADTSGVGIISVSRCCHLGRVGDYPLMAADKKKVAVMFVNTHGGGKLVAPWGGKERRLSANPIAAAIPRKDNWPILLDISTSSIAEGKVRGMFNRRASVPPGHIIDHEGNPTTDPAKFYGPPEGALLPFGGHKGYALGFLTDILAGALSGAGCSRKDTNRVGNSFLCVVIDPCRFRAEDAFTQDVEGLIQFVKSSALAPGSEVILIPGELEAQEKARREKSGIPIDNETWKQIAAVAERYNVKVPM
jgi:hydroxycarboxylate dehydrogenase B